MEVIMGVVETIALAMGASWASGLNLYAAVFTLGLMNATGGVALPPELQVLSSPAVMFVAGALYFVEFFADKIPGVDSAWDALHSFVRIPCGAILAAAAFWHVSPEAMLLAGLLGGTLATASHATKAGMRILINTSPEPFSNWAASVTEDVVAIGGVWMAMQHPVSFLIALAVALLFMAWALPKLWRGVSRLFTRVCRFFRGPQPEQQRPPHLALPKPR
jgi:hypothetical protein